MHPCVPEGRMGSVTSCKLRSADSGRIGRQARGTGVKDEKREKLGSGGFGRRCCLTARPAGQVVLQIA